VTCDTDEQSSGARLQAQIDGDEEVLGNQPSSAAKCVGLLTATITGMVAIVGDADSMEPFQRVRIGVTDSVGAHPDQEVVSIREDVAGPADHAVVRRIVPGAPVPLASRGRMDRDRCVAHLELIG
jgi:hypothetical protein